MPEAVVQVASMYGGNLTKDQCRREEDQKESLDGTHGVLLMRESANHQSCGSLRQDDGKKTLTIERLKVPYEPWVFPPSPTAGKAGSIYHDHVHLPSSVCFQKDINIEAFIL